LWDSDRGGFGVITVDKSRVTDKIQKMKI